MILEQPILKFVKMEAIRMDFSLLGNRIRNCRKSQGMSQATLAELTDVSVNYIGQIELADRHIGLDLLDRIAMVLGVSVMRLLCDINTDTLIVEEIDLVLRKCTNMELLIIRDMVIMLKDSMRDHCIETRVSS